MKNQKSIIILVAVVVVIAVLMAWVVWYYKANVESTDIPTTQTSEETNTNTVVNVNDIINVNTNFSANVNAESEATETEEEDTPITTVATSTVTVSKTFTETEPIEMTTLNEFSIATTAKVKESSRGITLRDVQVALYDSELLDTQYGPGRVSDLKCNDDYCLMTIRSAGWQYRVLKFADGEFTDISELIPNFDFGGTSYIEFFWTGNFWFINGGKHLLKYDGATMTQIDLPADLSTDMTYPQISSIGWNGEYLLVAYTSSCCVGQGIFQFVHVDTSGNIIEAHEAFGDYNYPTVSTLSWNGSNEWLVGGTYHSGIVFDQNPILIRYSTAGETIEDLSESIPNRQRLWIDQVFWDGTQWLIGFADTDSPYIRSRLYSYSPTNLRLVELTDFLLSFDQTNISTIDGRSDFYTIAGYVSPVANVVRNGQVRDLSDYFAMGVYSGTTQGDKVIIGGEGQLEVLSFNYEPKRTYTSDQINKDGEKVVAVTLTPKHILPAETSITYEVTNNYGASWYTVEPKVEFIFPEEGQHLLWRAVLQTENNTVTPSMASMEVSYVKFAD